MESAVYIPNNYLQHHGILGQKWGVRRYQNEDGTLTEEGRKRYGLRYETTIPKGSILYRTTSSKDESTSGEKYVTYFQSDRNFYRGQGADWIAGVQGKRYGELYEKQYVLKDDLKMPDRNEMIEVYKKVAKSSAKKREMAGQARVDMILRSYGFGEIQVDEISNAYYNRATKDGKALIEALKKEPQKWDNYDYYAQMVEGQVKALKESSNLSDEFFLYTTGFGSNMGKKLKAEFIDELKKRGYNAMTDEAGVGGHAGYTREARQTLILFDGDELLDTKSTSRLNEYVYAKANKEYTKWKKDLSYAEKKGFEHSSTGGESVDVVYIPSDYLMHWKYIDRYKRGGKWRYVYADSGVHDRIKRNINEEKSSSLMARTYQKNANDAEQQSILANKEHDYVTKQYADETYENASKEADYWRRLSNRYKVQADTIINSNSGSKALSNIKDDVISAGKSAIDSIFNLFKHSDSSDLYLEHHGILGQKWGVRRYQNEDGTLTEAGRKRYGTSENYEYKMERRKTIAKASGTAAKISAAIGAGVGAVTGIYASAIIGLPLTAAAITVAAAAGTEAVSYGISSAFWSFAINEIRLPRNYSDTVKKERSQSIKQSDLYLEHHGILGQKWGVRRYQNADGTLTPLGKKRRGSIRDYSDDELRSEIERSKLEKEYNREVGYGPKYYKGKTFKNPFTKKTVTSFASDQELEAYVNRRYLEMKVAEADAREVEQGLNYINNIMRTAGNVISTASSATKLISDIDKFVGDRKDKNDERKRKQQDDAKRKAIYDSTKELSTDSLESMTKRVKARWDYVDAVTGGGSGSNNSKGSNKNNKRSVFKVERKKKK